MTTLKEFEEALREQGMNMALALLERLRQRDRATRTVAAPRRIRGRKMTPELARTILELHQTTEMTQQEIAFKLGVNQGRVNEVIKRGKWLSGDPNAPEAVDRDKAVARMRRDPAASQTPRSRQQTKSRPGAEPTSRTKREPRKPPSDQVQLALGDL